MMPLLMRLKIGRDAGKRGVLLPIFIVWVLLLALMAVLLPLVLIAAILTWLSGQGPWPLLVYPLLGSVLFHLSGLHIEIERSGENVLIAFL